jgi:tetraacyldisaccharide 4'-kinase
MRWLEQQWYRNDAAALALRWLLWPFSLLFAALATLRLNAYRRGIFHTTKLPVPVVVIGNLSVGGTGKTPLTIALARQLLQRGRRPGIISRGYGGNARSPQPVDAQSNSDEVGDEPVLLARCSGCPVWVGADRVAAALALLNAHPECDILLSDDGLQHYALARDFEIAVIDAARGVGNGFRLPAGPLREPPSRLASVNAVVLNGERKHAAFLPAHDAVYEMQFASCIFSQLRDPQHQVPATYFADKEVHAVAGIGNPQRFFSRLYALGIKHHAHDFPDHHRFHAAEIDFGAGAEVIMTAKDAVKCERFALESHWVCQIDAVLDGDLAKQITDQLGRPL